MTNSMNNLPAWFADIQDYPLPTPSTVRYFETYTLQDLAQVYIHNRIVAITRVQLSRGTHKPHIHRNSEAVFVIEEGTASLIPQSIALRKGRSLHIPKNTPHGFTVPQSLTFISYQTPPIRDAETGEEDFHIWRP